MVSLRNGILMSALPKAGVAGDDFGLETRLAPSPESGRPASRSSLNLLDTPAIVSP